MFITSFGEQNITYKCCSNFLIHLYTRWYWGTYGWSAWLKLATTESIKEVIKPFEAQLELQNFTSNIEKDLRNPLKPTVIKLIGDSITWGMGSSATSLIEPRTGTLTDVRNTTAYTSKTWANLLRQYIAKVYGDGNITEDKPGSAFTTCVHYYGWKESYKNIKMINTLGEVVTDQTKSNIIENFNISTSFGTIINLISPIFPSVGRPVSMEIELEGDNLTFVYQKQAAGDANDKIKVYLDDEFYDEFSYYSTTVLNDVEYSMTFPFGKHKVRFVNESISASSYARISGFKITKKIWVMNDGIIGSSTATWLDRSLYEGTLTGNDDYILLMLGTNDRATIGGVEGYKRRLETGLDKIKTLSPKSKLILMSSTYAANESPTTYKFNMGMADKVMSSVASERNLHFISQYKGCAQALLDSEAIWSDGLHLNDNGNKIYYQNIKNSLFKV